MCFEESMEKETESPHRAYLIIREKIAFKICIFYITSIKQNINCSVNPVKMFSGTFSFFLLKKQIFFMFLVQTVIMSKNPRWPPKRGHNSEDPLFFFGRHLILDSQHVKLAYDMGLIKSLGGGEGGSR